MRTCKICSLTKDIIEFTSYTDNRTDKSYVRNNCKVCENDRLRNYRRSQQRLFRANNPGYNAMQSRKYALSHWDETLARNRDHKARRRVSSIKYLTLEHKKQIREFYNNCPKGFEVDHIIPIKGDGINGLHVIHNLQYLTKEENRRKGNRL